MSLSSWIRSSLGSSGPSARKKPKDDPRRGFTHGAPVAGPNLNAWTDSRLDQVKSFKHWVYVAVDLIANRIASQFPNVGYIQKKDPNPKNWGLLPFQKEKALTPLFGQEDLIPVGHEHPLVKLFKDPNDPDTSFDLWYETIMFMLLTGSAYWWIPKNKVTGLPAAIWCLPSHWVWPVFDRDGAVYAYDLRPAEGNYLRKQFPAEEIIHFRKKNAYSKIDGYSPLTATSQWIDSSLAIERSRFYTFKNGAFPSTALEFDPEYIDPTDEDLARIESKFLARYAGETRAGKPLLLPPGVKFHKLSLMPREMDYQKSADQLRDNVLAGFKVPSILAGAVTETTNAAVLAANTLFCGNCLNPFCRMLGQTATEHFSDFYNDPSLRIYWEDFTTDDPAVVEKRIQNDIDAMAIVPNEIRILRGREPYKFGGWDPFLPHVGLGVSWNTNEETSNINPFKDKTNLKDKSKEPKENNDEAPKENGNE